MTLIFDVDGTLLDTPAGIVDAVVRTSDELGLAKPRDEAVRAMIGKPLTDMFRSFTWAPAELDQAIIVFRKHFTEQVVSRAPELVFPGIENALAVLNRSTRLAIATSKVVSSAEEILSAAGILHYFDTVAGADSVTKPKPFPEMALLAAHNLGTDPSGCTVIGDSIHDIGMARAAGMRSVGVTWGVDDSIQLAAAGASAICKNPHDLIGLLKDRAYSMEEA